MANNLKIIGNHLITINGEWPLRKLVELPKIGGCLQHLLPLTTMEHYRMYLLVIMLKDVEHKQKLIVHLHSVVSKIQSMEIGTAISRVHIIITKQLLMEFTLKGTKTKPAFFESVLFKILDEITAGHRKSKVMPREFDPFYTRLSNFVKHAKGDYEIMVY